MSINFDPVIAVDLVIAQLEKTHAERWRSTNLVGTRGSCSCGFADVPAELPCEAHPAVTQPPYRIVVECVYPPIPIRRFDYMAYDDRTFDGLGSVVGWGASEAEAIADFRDNWADRYEDDKREFGEGERERQE